MSRPRSAPACSTASRMSVSISRASTISLDSACEALTTDSTSNCLTGVPIVAVKEAEVASSCKRGYRASNCATLPFAPQRS